MKMLILSLMLKTSCRWGSVCGSVSCGVILSIMLGRLLCQEASTNCVSAGMFPTIRSVISKVSKSSSSSRITNW